MYDNLIKDASVVRSELSKNSEYNDGLAKNIKRVAERIEETVKLGKSCVCFNVESKYEREVKELFLAKGYKFKPTGYIGGVWQLSEDICW